MDVDRAYDLIARAIDGDRAAGGYLICGDLRGSCAELLERLLLKLYPGEEERIRQRNHPDVFFVEPQGRSRTIKVERGHNDDGPGVRDGLVAPMAATSFSGGWKTGVLVGADLMQPAAANALLKTLEEPPPHALFLLLTDHPESILPTIISRTQRIDLGRCGEVLDGEAYDAVVEVMTGVLCTNAFFAKSRAAKRLADILGQLKDEAADEDVPVVRKAFFRTILSFVRGWMVEARVEYRWAFVNVEAVEEAARRCERAIGDEAALAYMMDRLVFPPAAEGRRA